MRRGYQRYIYRDLFKAGVIAVFVFLVWYSQSVEAFHWSQIPFAFCIGVFTGIIELVLFRKFFPDLSFPVTILGKVVLYYLGALALILFFTLVVQVGIERSSTVQEAMEEIFSGSSLIKLFQLLFPIFCIVLFLHVELLVGKGIFGKYLQGVYFKPRVEERVFLFLDMNNSTTLTENLGDRQYFRLLNSFFRDMSRAIYESGGEVYKYMGDEIIVSWPVRKKVPFNACVLSVFNIYHQIQTNRMRYLRNFGAIPDFKAGMHVGKVICAQVGDLKKEIAYNGDVLNTASRLQGVCKNLGKRFIISKDVFDRIENPEQFKHEKMGAVRLEGKSQELELIIMDLKDPVGVRFNY